MQAKVYPIMMPTRSSLKSFNFYLLQKEQGFSLIDAGIHSEKCWDYFQSTLKEYQLSLKDIKEIILTHNHEDHVGLVDRIVGRHDIPVFAPKNSIHRLKRDRSFFEMRIEFFRNLYQQMDCGERGDLQVEKLEEALQQHEKKKLHADIIPITKLPNLEPIETPGHSPDHMVFYHPHNRSLFAGDLFLKHISSNALVEPDQDGNRMFTLLDHEKSLERCLSLDVDIAYPGHGDIIDNHKDLINRRLDGIKRKADKVYRKVKEGHQTGSQIAQEMYDEKYESQFSLVMSEIIGHLDYLEAHDKVKKERINGVIHYEHL